MKAPKTFFQMKKHLFVIFLLILVVYGENDSSRRRLNEESIEKLPFQSTIALQYNFKILHGDDK